MTDSKVSRDSGSVRVLYLIFTIYSFLIIVLIKYKWIDLVIKRLKFKRLVNV